MVNGVYFHSGVLSYIYDEAILGRIVKQFLLLGSFFLGIIRLLELLPRLREATTACSYP